MSIICYTIVIEHADKLSRVKIYYSLVILHTDGWVTVIINYTTVF